MKKIPTICTLLLLFYTQCGYYGQFIILQWQIKEAAREAWIAALPDNSFLRISVDDINNNGKWEDDGKECWYNGHLYDIIRTRHTGNTTWAFCLDDQREETLIRNTGEITRAGQEHPDKKPGHSLSFSAGDQLCERTSFPIPPLTLVLPRHNPRGNSDLRIRPVDILVPPPKA